MAALTCYDFFPKPIKRISIFVKIMDNDKDNNHYRFHFWYLASAFGVETEEFIY